MTALWQAIDRYLAERAPTDTHKIEVRRYRQRLHDIFSREYNMLAFFQSGSFQHGTAVMPYSDVDYIVRIHFEDRPSSSTTILNRMRDLLTRELTEATSVSVSRPAVTIKFPSIVADYEITPAYLVRGSTDEDRVVVIPASEGQWREAAPQAHNKFVAEIDRKHNGAARELARLLKAWKYQHSVPISSFYLEMRSAEYGKNNSSIWALASLRSIVTKLISTELAAMNDPTLLVSRITACSAESSRRVSMMKLRTLKSNLDIVYDEWSKKVPDMARVNVALRDIWGYSFPYCTTITPITS